MEKAYQLLGLAMRAGKVVSGVEEVRQAMRRDRLFLVIMAEDIAANSRERLWEAGQRKALKIVSWGDRYQLGRAIGKEYRVAVGIVDSGFAEAIVRALPRECQN